MMDPLQSNTTGATAANGGWDVRVVERLPTWRGHPYTLTYVLPDHEPTAEELVRMHHWAYGERLSNPRIIAPSVLEWSSLFHPRFFDAVVADRGGRSGRLTWTCTAAALQPAELARFWLESVMFLAGVTLSAAIVQSRYSAGTLASKYDRLWEAGTLADTGVVPELQSLGLLETVSALAFESRCGDIDRLLAIRRLFLTALARMARLEGELTTMTRGELPTETAARFGFVDALRRVCGVRLRALIAYGSSLSSEDFADYDLLVVTDNPESVLRQLAGRSPKWRGKELNIGVYSQEELVVMQRLSGDNLADYGVCLWGETAVVHKPVGRLLARNFSFGVVRQRQQLGMLSRAVGEPNPADGDDRRNLHEYFVKIPANVAKGTFGALGQRLPKEQVQTWMKDRLGFDALREQRRATEGDPAGALAAAAIATGTVLKALNEQVRIVGSCPHDPVLEKDGL